MKRLHVVTRTFELKLRRSSRKKYTIRPWVRAELNSEQEACCLWWRQLKVARPKGMVYCTSVALKWWQIISPDNQFMFDLRFHKLSTSGFSGSGEYASTPSSQKAHKRTTLAQQHEPLSSKARWQSAAWWSLLNTWSRAGSRRNQPLDEVNKKGRK